MDREGYLPVPTFDFSSAFNYRSCMSDEWPEDSLHLAAQSRAPQKPVQQLAYYLLTSLSILFFLLTVPISSFFCIKRVSSLQRCLTYRLGNRLPLKGPGFILKLPFIDHISIIDLYEECFNIIKAEEQILTGDGSIIVMRPCQASLNVTNAVLTTLKIGEVNVQECLRLRFGNVLRSKHVEDLENKIDFIVRQFEEDCNKFLQRWGYSLKLEQMPRFTVVERADPINPIKSKLTKLLNPDEANPSSPAEALLNMLGPLVPPLGIRKSPQAVAPGDSTEKSAEATAGSLLTDDELSRTLPVMQSFIDQYKAYLQGHELWTVELICLNGTQEPSTVLRNHFFQYRNGSIQSVHIRPTQVNMTVRFESYSNLESFLATQDTKYVQYSFN